MRCLHKFAMENFFLLVPFFLCNNRKYATLCNQNYWKYLRQGNLNAQSRGSKSKIKCTQTRVECTRNVSGISVWVVPFGQKSKTFDFDNNKKYIANYIIGQKKANYFSLMKILFFCELPDPLRFSIIPRKRPCLRMQRSVHVLVRLNFTIIAWIRLVFIYEKSKKAFDVSVVYVSRVNLSLSRHCLTYMQSTFTTFFSFLRSQ